MPHQAMLVRVELFDTAMKLILAHGARKSERICGIWLLPGASSIWLRFWTLAAVQEIPALLPATGGRADEKQLISKPFVTLRILETP
jgi:hypothetical protein